MAHPCAAQISHSTFLLLANGSYDLAVWPAAQLVCNLHPVAHADFFDVALGTVHNNRQGLVVDQKSLVEFLEVDSIVSLKKAGIAGLSLAHDLIPVAAQLSAGHMRWWIAIVDSMRQLSEASQRDHLRIPLQCLRTDRFASTGAGSEGG